MEFFCGCIKWYFTVSYAEWEAAHQRYVHRPQRWKEAAGSSGRPHGSIAGERPQPREPAPGIACLPALVVLEDPLGLLKM